MRRLVRGGGATGVPGAGRQSLLFDRGRLSEDNAYTLDDGARIVRFETCAGRPTTFVGAVVTTGSDRAPLDVEVEGGLARRIELIALPPGK